MPRWGRDVHSGRAQEPYRCRASAFRPAAAALGEADDGHSGGGELIGGADRGLRGRWERAGARADRDSGPQSGCHGDEAGEAGGIVTVRMQVDGAAVFRGDVQDGFGVSGRVGVEVGAAADDADPHLHRVAEHREAVGSRRFL